ncbi:DUF6894 family protein [Salinarimonas soli]|uniref:DUF6894 domain-containing protein n=1 Tax=Salinarimonas soli TaxID=1638099 RepID=A0A5B2VCX4_9HYPH|nr:hypothetical protein [Salinarimonas soli]KAA2235987.1 hypothetical protein F0L46_17140 [Salinarimonas soli]
MARFYFDIADGDHINTDDSGHDLADAQAARTRAVDALRHIASDLLSAGDEQSLLVTVRDENGDRILTAGLVAKILPSR